jgi:hypothetical protein
MKASSRAELASREGACVAVCQRRRRNDASLIKVRGDNDCSRDQKAPKDGVCTTVEARNQSRRRGKQQTLRERNGRPKTEGEVKETEGRNREGSEMRVIREREGAGIVGLWKARNPGGTTWHGDRQGGRWRYLTAGLCAVVWTVVGRKCLQDAKQGNARHSSSCQGQMKSAPGPQRRNQTSHNVAKILGRVWIPRHSYITCTASSRRSTNMEKLGRPVNCALFRLGPAGGVDETNPALRGARQDPKRNRSSPPLHPIPALTVSTTT